MADDLPNRRKFLQRTFFALTGATIGAGIAVNQNGNMDPVESDKDIPPEVPKEPKSDPKKIRDEQKQANPFDGELPDAYQTGTDDYAQKHSFVQREQQTPKRKPGKHTDLPDDQERVLKGAIVGGTVGLGAHMMLNVSSSKSAEAGATQNDPERVEWERRQAIIREMDERHRNRE